MSHKPKLGQNFLHDQSAIERIASSLGDLSTRTVIEIGPGRGAITHLLAKTAGHLIAIELDRELGPALREHYADANHIEVVEQDVLTVNLTELAKDNRVSVIGNLPYYITSDILLHLFAHHEVIDQAVLMVQKEVADRVAATPGTRDYGVLSATAQMYGKVEKLFTLPPGAFSPPPEVYSTVFRIRFAPRFEELNVHPEIFLPFVRKCFAQKRKTLSNNLRAAGFSSSQLQSAFETTQIDPQIRAEALTLDRMAQLWKELAN